MQHQIGRGGFGTVYQGYRIADGLPVAIKFVRHRQVVDWTLTADKQLIPTEICFLEDCHDCEGVVHIVDWFSNRRGFLIVMQRPRAFMDLFDFLDTFGRLDEQIARDIFAQVVHTAVQLHQRHSIVHRDIKDENIVLDMDTGRVWLCDLGAAEYHERARFRHFRGTRSYCPPEVFKRQCYLPLEGTVWSLGILLYTLLVGHPPFRNELQICVGKVHFPAHISHECRSLIENCLSPVPECRLALTELHMHKWLAGTNADDRVGTF